MQSCEGCFHLRMNLMCMCPNKDTNSRSKRSVDVWAYAPHIMEFL